MKASPDLGHVCSSTAASIVGAGLSLQVQDNTLKKQQVKIRPLAACVIQTFVRQHLMLTKFNAISIYG
jgi:hypothetical protein